MSFVSLSGVTWRKSSRSQPAGTDCVEVAAVGPVRALRDSKNPHGDVIAVRPDVWRGLLHDIKSGAYDL
ncbi:DUF397 domain-containing protein [Actinomadura rugatobispora]|uniref:DUF397 domain-containing protein n=1 Tax=Actinomadura rugatobispora TaxID=1994 RepID=A0ABW1A6R8_9ACTN|nr:DUF397 domain-containing protein [Actinomadura rugatobispora]